MLGDEPARVWAKSMSESQDLTLEDDEWRQRVRAGLLAGGLQADESGLFEFDGLGVGNVHAQLTL